MSERFTAIVGQDVVKARFDALLDAWANGRGSLHHAYLFVGQPGLGKRALAEELAASLVAHGRRDEAYDRALRGAHPDVCLIEREGDVIRYEQVTRLVAELSLKPFLAAERVWVIDDADKLHPAAANKLLKSLEEPPPHVFFILVSSEAERLLPTIVSRCELVRFSPVPRHGLLDVLRTRSGLSAETIEAIANVAGGSPGVAAELAEDALGDDRRGAVVSLTLRAVAGESVAAEAAAIVASFERSVATQVEEQAATEAARVEASIQDERDRAWHLERLREKARRDSARRTRRVALWCADVVTAVLRDVWVASIDAGGVLLNSDHRAAIRAAAAAGGPHGLSRALIHVGEARKDLQLNVDRELAMLALFARLEEVCAA